ncbi:hypothetical protein WH95_00600 [Kiloniella litopenaei]|uniref:Uncharacterized protein n=1 Tax=Kiloniella litopenaei TaxID=1549748 RepID=A0A0M2RF40_9PROT|nr:hypothetical protein [Kiloniella litopenaei]KKJ78635.1 hypothetical protein WH95_00600 [Kiloniella litopenaei]
MSKLTTVALIELLHAIQKQSVLSFQIIQELNQLKGEITTDPPPLIEDWQDASNQVSVAIKAVGNVVDHE